MKEQIIETSLQEFLKHGIRKMTIQKLVLALGISTKTMYKYFGNKEELLEECLKIHYGEADKEVKNILEGSPNVVASVCRIYSKAIEADFGTNHLFYYDLNHYYPELQDKVIRQYSSGALEILAGLIDQGINEGYFLSYLKAPVVLETLNILYGSVTRSNVYKKFGLKRELVNQTINIYLRGICTGTGLEIINQLKGSSN